MAKVTEAEYRAAQDRHFMENVHVAREGGYELVCSECGVGIADELDTHEYDCPRNPDHERNIEAMLAEVRARSVREDGPSARS